MNSTEKIIPHAVEVSALKKLFLMLTMSPAERSKPSSAVTVPNKPSKANNEINVVNSV